MKKIEVTARFEVTIVREVSDEVFEALKNGADIGQVVDESEAYKLAATEGTCAMEWDYANTTMAQLATKMAKRSASTRGDKK